MKEGGAGFKSSDLAEHVLNSSLLSLFKVIEVVRIKKDSRTVLVVKSLWRARILVLANIVPVNLVLFSPSVLSQH